MSKLFQKLTLSFLVGLIILFSFAPFLEAKAASPAPSTPPQGTWYNESFSDWYKKVYDENTSPSNEIFGERYTAAQVQWVIYSIWSFLINSTVNAKIAQCFLSTGVDINTCLDIVKGLIVSNTDQSKLAAITPPKYNTATFLSAVFATDRPISGIGYVKEKLENFSLVPTARAQTVGFGYQVLSPIRDFWTASRNVAFSLAVIAAIVLAFMVMFRVKISPQVVISVQSAIPKVIIALILITFSYAIAGFLIDLMYFVIGILSLIGAAYLPLDGVLVTQKAQMIFNMMTVGQIIGGNIQMGVFGVMINYLLLFPIALFVVLFAQLGLLGGQLLGALGAVGLIALGPGGIIVFIVLGVIIFIIMVIIAIIHIIKTFWMLVKAFAYIMILLIFAPIQIAVGVVIPNFGFSQWLKSFASNLAVFVVTGFLIFLSYLFLFEGTLIGVGGTVGIGQRIVTLIFGAGISSFFFDSQAWPPLLGNGSAWAGLSFLGVSFVIFTLIPKANEIIQGFLSGKPFAYGSAIGETMGPLTGTASAVTGAVQKGIQEEIAKRSKDWAKTTWDSLRNRGTPSSTAGGGATSGPTT